MPSIKEITSHLESIAPPSYQEGYDNSGLICGNPATAATGAILSLDATEEVVDEAIERGVNMVIAHHPIVFKGLKKLNGKNYVERAVIKAIKNEVAIYAIHTNLDNVFHRGVNAKIAEKLGLENTRILAPKKLVKKLSAIVSPPEAEAVRAALFAAGAGQINGEKDGSFTTLGVGSGHAAKMKTEVLFPPASQGAVVAALHSLVPDAPFEIHAVENVNHGIGSGMIGDLPKAMKETAFLKMLKKAMKAGVVKHTRLLEKPIEKVAFCGGSGSFLLPHAIRQKADVYVTGDYKYHEFFDADGKLVIADIGHFESEQYTIELLGEIIREKFPTFALHFTKVNTNPVYYF